MTKQEIATIFAAIDAIQAGLDSLTLYVAAIESKPKATSAQKSKKKAKSASR
jgi:hypothetical protein